MTVYLDSMPKGVTIITDTMTIVGTKESDEDERIVQKKREFVELQR